MPFVEESVTQKIEEMKGTSPEFRQAWDESREEYRLIGEMVSLRKRAKMTQTQLAVLTGSRQQVISRIEKHENIPSLRAFCNILSALGYEMKIVKKASPRYQ